MNIQPTPCELSANMKNYEFIDQVLVDKKAVENTEVILRRGTPCYEKYTVKATEPIILRGIDYDVGEDLMFPHTVRIK